MAVAMVGHVPDERPTEYTRFVQAVLAFAVDPGPANVERYLAASQRAIILSSATRPQENQPRTRLVLVGGRKGLAWPAAAIAEPPPRDRVIPAPLLCFYLGRSAARQESLAGDRRRRLPRKRKGPASGAFSDGRTWDRNRRRLDPLRATEGDSSRSLQRKSSSAENDGDPSLTTAFHPALGQQVDMADDDDAPLGSA